MQFDPAPGAGKKALATRSSGVPTVIDVKATMSSDLAADLRPYAILGGCDPWFAH